MGRIEREKHSEKREDLGRGVRKRGQEGAVMEARVFVLLVRQRKKKDAETPY